MTGICMVYVSVYHGNTKKAVDYIDPYVNLKIKYYLRLELSD